MSDHQQGNITWHFPRKERCSNYAPDELLQTFNEYKLSGLVRENIQNSLDARHPDCSCVKVCISTGSIATDALPHIHELQSHIAVLQGKNEQITKKIAVMQQVMAQAESRYISFEDSNTTGLSSENWEAYAYSKGWHPTLDSREDERRRGGSHGVGKIASNAASELNLAYFINRNETSSQYGATAELIDHSLEGYNHDRTGLLAIRREERAGLFGLKKKGESITISAIDNILTHPLFQKSERGLKIVIPFVRPSYFDLNQTKKQKSERPIDDTRQLIRAVCDSFFIALLKGELAVDINGCMLDQTTLHEHISDEAFFPLDFHSSSKKKNTNYTRYYVQAYESGTSFPIEVKDKVGTIHRFTYHLWQESSIASGCSSVIRRMGMSVHSSPFSCTHHPLCGVLIPDSHDEDTFLKSMENKSHTQLDPKMLDERKEQENARRFLNMLQKAVAECINRQLLSDVAESEELDTSDIFYSRSTRGISSVLRKAKKQVKPKSKVMTMSAVGETTPSEELEDIYTDERDDDASEDGSRDESHDQENPPQPPAPSTAESSQESAPPTSSVAGTPDGQGRKRRHYAMRESSVDRLVAHGEDDIELRVNTRGVSKPCRVRFTPINGEGKKEGQPLNLQQIYQSIIAPDLLTEPARFCEEQPDSIDTHIINNLVSLRLRFHPQANQNLKYEFVVEH